LVGGVRGICEQDAAPGEQTGKAQAQTLERIRIGDRDGAGEAGGLDTAGETQALLEQFTVSDADIFGRDRDSVFHGRESLSEQTAERLLRYRNSTRDAWRPVPGWQRTADLGHDYP